MPTMICPKCGFQQEKELECWHCGIIFERFHSALMSPWIVPYEASPETNDRPRFELLLRFYRLFRWVALAGLVTAIALILHASMPPEIETSADATHRAAAKVQEFQSSALHGRGETLEMNQSELNGWLSENLALNQPNQAPAVPPTQSLDTAISLAKKVTALKAGENPIVEQSKSSVRDLKIALHEDSLLIYTSFDFYGMALSLELEGQIMVRDGYLRLVTTRGKLGSLPLLAGTLQGVTSRLFDAPDDKERLHLPPHIRDMRIEHGQIVVYPR
jgi:hypothetical protein